MNPFDTVGQQLKKISRKFKNPQKVILFLDFDGVLHPYGWDAHWVDGRIMKPREWEPFEQAPRLRKALKDRPFVEVVVHSSWRRHHSPAEISDFLGIGDQFKSITNKKIMERWDSIQDYLRNQEEWPPKPFLIADDMWYAFPATIRKEHLICPVAIEGMNEDLWLELERRLDDLAYTK